MPTIGNITVKKNDGTTDITYTALTGSGGDSAPARWSSKTVGTAPAHQPVLTLSSRDNGPKTARRLDGQLVYPYLVTDGGLTTVKGRAIINVSGVIPKEMPQADINEAVSQAVNAFAHAQFKDSFKEGYAAV